MSIFDFAMQMELDGEKLYRELADKTTNTGLKKIFSSLADEEVVHYNVFKNIKGHSSLDVEGTTILEDSKNIFAQMKESGDINISKDQGHKEAYQLALEMEKKAYLFFEEKAQETQVPAEEKLLKAIAREERRHHRLIEGIIDFISQPELWLENAEFVHLTDY